MSGWVKLHRQILENDFLQNDINAYVMFTKLLMVANHKTGKYITGRFKLADLCNMNPSTARDTLKRLEKHKMTTLEPDNHKTIISICNWSKFQSKDDTKPDNQTTTRRQPDDTKQERRIKNKEIVSKDTGVVSKLYYDYLKKYRIPVLNHNTLRLKIKELEDINGTEWSIRYLTFMLEQYESLDMKYKPEINDALDLFKKSKSIEEKLKKYNQSEEIY